MCAFIDLSKAFNRVDHTLVIQDLFDMHTPAWLLRIMISYLSGRKMIMKFCGKESQETLLPAGGPQGTRRCSWSERRGCAAVGSSGWWWERPVACCHSGPVLPAAPDVPVYCREGWKTMSFIREPWGSILGDIFCKTIILSWPKTVRLDNTPERNVPNFRVSEKLESGQQQNKYINKQISLCSQCCDSEERR